MNKYQKILLVSIFICIPIMANASSYSKVFSPDEPKKLTSKKARIMVQDAANWLETKHTPSETTISLFRKYRSFGINFEKELRKKGFGVIVDRYSENELPVSYKIVEIPEEKVIILLLEAGNMRVVFPYSETKNSGVKKIANPTTKKREDRDENSFNKLPSWQNPKR